MSDLSSDFPHLRGAASDINNVAADLSDIVSVAITASSVVEGLSSDFGGLMSAVAATSVGMRAAVGNVTPLAGAFRQLQEHTGAAQTANKSMIAGLAGFIGKVDLASIAVSLLIEYGDDLVRALTSGGESAEELRERIAGISEYTDFSVEIDIIGMDKVDALTRKLEAADVKIAMLNQEAAFLERREALPPKWKSNLEDAMLRSTNYSSLISPGVGVMSLPGESKAHLKSEGTLAREALDADEKAYRQEHGKKIIRGIEAAKQNNDYTKYVNYGAARNKSFLESLGYSSDQIKLFEERLQIYLEKAKDAKQLTNELANEFGNAGKEAEEWGAALAEAETALAGIDNDAMTVAQATASVAEAETALNAAIADGISGRKNLKDATNAVKTATSEYNKAQKQATKVTEDWNKAISSAKSEIKVFNKLLGIQEDETISIESAVKNATDAYKKLNEVMQDTASTDDDVTKAKEKLAEANKKVADSTKQTAEAYAKQTEDIVGAIGTIGNAYSKITGSSIPGIGLLADAAKNIRGEFDGYDSETDKEVYKNQDPLMAGLQIADFVGQNIGGRVGGVISSTAGMASAGASLGAALATGGGPYGAAIGAAIGLVSSLFSNDDEERRARRDEARQQAFNAIQDMALSGGPLSAELMRRSDWSWQNLSVLRHTPDLSEEFGAWWPERLMADNGVEGIADRQEMITAIDNLLLSIKGFTEAGFSQSLDKLNIKYEYLAEKSHNLALVEKARLTDLIQLVTGINAETVVGSVSNAMSAAAAQGGDVGEIFMEGFTREILDGVADTAISQFVTSSIMPILEKPLAQIAQSMTAGEGFDASALAEAVSLAKSAAASVAPAVQELYEVFETSGMWASAIGEIHPLVTEVMGVSAESLTNVILQSFASLENEGGNIGDVFVRNFMSSVEDGLMIFAASQLVENVLSGMMQPVLGSIAEAISTTQMVSASLIESSMVQITAIAKQAAPYVESLYKAFGGSKRAAPVRYSLGGKSRSTSNNQLAKALRSLESFRAGMFADTSISPGNIGAVQTQQSAVRTLVAQALHGADNDSRMAAMQNLPGAVSSSLQSALAVTANPLEYSRQVGEMSNMLAGVTGGRDATLRNVVTEIRELRRENEQLREIMAQLLDSGNENTDKLVSLTREIVQNSY